MAAWLPLTEYVPLLPEKPVRSVKVPFASLKLMVTVRFSPGSGSLTVRLPNGLTLLLSPTLETVVPAMVGASLIDVALTTEEVLATAADRWPSLTATVKVVLTTAPTEVWLSVG